MQFVDAVEGSDEETDAGKIGDGVRSVDYDRDPGKRRQERDEATYARP